MIGVCLEPDAPLNRQLMEALRHAPAVYTSAAVSLNFGVCPVIGASPISISIGLIFYSRVAPKLNDSNYVYLLLVVVHIHPRRSIDLQPMM
jgi:hypothetical protein